MNRRWLIAAGASVAAFAALRARSRGPSPGPPELVLDEVTERGKDGGEGNLIVCQPWMFPSDYSSGHAFAAKLGGYFEAAHRRGLFGPRSVVVLPAHIGTFLVVAGEARRVFRARTFEEAGARTVASNLPRFLLNLSPFGVADPFTAAFFRAKAAKMAALYTHALSSLAARFGVTVVGGSLLLPEPIVERGAIRPGRGPLYEVCAVFAEDGHALAPLAKKAALEPSEGGFLAAGDLSRPAVLDTPAGRLGMLLGRDAFAPSAYTALRAQQAELVVVPAYLPGPDAWTQVWPGFRGQATPADADPADEGRLTEGQAWQRYGPGGRLAEAGARAGAAAFFRGALWDRAADGAALVMRDGELAEGPHVLGATITCQWL